MLVLVLSWHLLLTEGLPLMALQLKSRFVCEDNIIELLFLNNELFTPVEPVLLDCISNCLTVSRC